MNFPQDHEFELVRNDSWLISSASEVADRHRRYQERLKVITREFGSLYSFAGGHHYLGFSFDLSKGELTYREWAPAAHGLFLIGDFNAWDSQMHPLTKDEYGIWHISISMKPADIEHLHGSRVKVLVKHDQGEQARIPAYIRRVVQDPETRDFSGQLWLSEEFDWGDQVYRLDNADGLLIYECHPGMAQEKEGVGTWDEFRTFNLPRIKAAGYNAIQMMAVMEHPYYGSFGYHVSNFFAPSSRFGTPEDLKRLIRDAHEMGIAVIMDVIHSHTVKNTNEGINQFDGSESLYFHPGERGVHPDWDSRLFDYGKSEVQRFLLSNLRYWLEEFRFDGFRFDGVGSMMYFHHGHEVFDSPEKYFSQGVEWDAITYLQLANDLIHSIRPDAVSIAEDVTGMPGLCRPIPEGGIGFDYRLGMGLPDFWVETLKTRKDEEWDLTQMWHVLSNRRPDIRTVAYCESHDQALVGDKTLAFWLMDKEMYFHMRKDDTNLAIDRGIALHKMIRLITLSLGGQAWLNFMGNEFGHPEWIDFPREGNNWSYKYARRQWSLADDPELKYHYLRDWDRDMLKLAREHHLLSDGYGTQLWLDDWHKTLAYARNGLVFIFNFHFDLSVPDYEVPVQRAGIYRIILDSDLSAFGGHGRLDHSITYPTRFDESRGQHLLRIYNPNRTAFVLEEIV
jgi:1,4-alpha-glucan branching enzyme